MGRTEVTSYRKPLPFSHTPPDPPIPTIFWASKNHWVSEWSRSVVSNCDPMDCSLQGSSVHGIFQAKVLEWVAISFSRGSSRPRDQTQVSHIAGKRFTIWATREAISCKDGHDKGQKWQGPNRSKRDLEDVARIYRKTSTEKVLMIWVTMMVWSLT